MDRGSQRESESEKPLVVKMIISWVEREEPTNNTDMRGYCDTAAFISFDLEILLKAVIDYYSNMILLHLQLSARAVLESNVPATIMAKNIT